MYNDIMLYHLLQLIDLCYYSNAFSNNADNKVPHSAWQVYNVGNSIMIIQQCTLQHINTELFRPIL